MRRRVEEREGRSQVQVATYVYSMVDGYGEYPTAFQEVGLDTMVVTVGDMEEESNEEEVEEEEEEEGIKEGEEGVSIGVRTKIKEEENCIEFTAL